MNNDTSSTIAPAKMFKGYSATVAFEDGKEVPVYVINERAEMKFSDGSIGAAIKVRYVTHYLVGAGHRYATQYSTECYWIKASRMI